MAYTLRQIQRSVLQVWGLETDVLAPGYAYMNAEATSHINAAFQEIWSYGEDYFNRTTVAITLTPSTQSYALDDTIQNVVDPVIFQVDGTPLKRLQTRGEFYNYGRTFIGKASNTLAEARPTSYFIDQRYQAGNDPAKATLFVTPTPNTSETLLLEAISEPPKYTQADICADGEVPIPHKYVESILLPIARYRATTNWQAWTSPAQVAAMPQAKEFYQQALETLKNIRTRREQPHVDVSMTPSSKPNPYQTGKR